MAALNKEQVAEIVSGAVEKLAVAITKQFDELKGDNEKAHAEIKNNVNTLINSVDSFAKETTTVSQEQVFTKNRIDRHEKWIDKVAAKVGVKLEY